MTWQSIQAKRHAFIDLHAQGFRIPAIARIMEVIEPTVRNYLKQSGIAMQPRGWHLKHPHRHFHYA